MYNLFSNNQKIKHCKLHLSRVKTISINYRVAVKLMKLS